MNEIERLKNKNYVRAFGLLSPEEQDVISDAGKKNCMFYDTGGWRNCGSAMDRYEHMFTYAIKPDYQPEHQKENRMKDIIKKLKDKTYVRPFGLMAPEEQECFRKVKRYNCVCFAESIVWISCSGGIFANVETYAIKPKPDYQPESEFVDLEIAEHAQGIVQIWWLGVWKDKHEFLPYDFTHLHYLPSLPKFEGFYLKDSDSVEVRPEWVARNHPNVIARFGA